MVINAWSWDCVELLSRPVCQLTISFHTFLGMLLHIVRPRRNTQIFRAWYFSVAPAEILDSNMVLSKLDEDIWAQFVSKLQKILQQIHFLRFENDVNPSMVSRFYMIVGSFLFASSQYFPTHFFVWPSMSKDHENIVSASGFSVAFVPGCFPTASVQILDLNILL